MLTHLLIIAVHSIDLPITALHGCQYLHIDQSSAAVLDRNVPSPPDKPSVHTESDSSSTLATADAEDSTMPPYGYKCSVYPILATRKQLPAAALVAASWQALSPSDEDLVRQPVLKELMQLPPASEAAASSLERALLDKHGGTGTAAATAAASDKRGGILTAAAAPPHVARCALLLALNKQLHEALPYLDLSQADRCVHLL
jgi:hypothetical protein